MNLSKQILVLKEEVKELKKRLEVINVVKGIDLKNGDAMGFARNRVNTLIREIDKCISLLND